jgi:hypothetical protein
MCGFISYKLRFLQTLPEFAQTAIKRWVHFCEHWAEVLWWVYGAPAFSVFIPFTKLKIIIE